MSNRTIYLNGQFLPESEAKVSVYDLGVMQAAAVFEMTRSFHGQHFKLVKHIERLRASMVAIGINDPHPRQYEWESLCETVSSHNTLFPHHPFGDQGEEHRLLIMVSPGPAPMYREIAGSGPTVLITDFPLRYTTAGLGRQFEHGGTAIISSIQQVPDACVPSSAKHRSRLHFHLAQEEAKRKGADWAILLDHYGAVTECPGANIFIVSDGILKTPAENCLKGISRATIYELARARGIACYGKIMARNELFLADEVFVTGTPFCAISIVSIDGRQIGDGKPGPVYKALMNKWNELVGLNIAEQIIHWDLVHA